MVKVSFKCFDDDLNSNPFSPTNDSIDLANSLKSIGDEMNIVMAEEEVQRLMIRGSFRCCCRFPCPLETRIDLVR